MASQGSGQRVWTGESVQELVASLKDSSPAQIDLIKKQFEPIIYTTTLKLRKEYYYLLFDPDPEVAPEISDESLELLIGPDFEKKRQNYLNKPIDHVIDHPSCPVKTLSDVQPPYALSHFNLLSRNRGIRVRCLSSSDLVEIPPVVNLCIALSTIACQQRRGIFLWQRKKRTTDAGHAGWQRVPDLLLFDYDWDDVKSQAFLHALYVSKRDFLCANGRLRSMDPVLPFLLDFPGSTLRDAFDARVTADVDHIHAPKAAISIPGAAYIGWLDQFLAANPQDYEKFFRQEKVSDTMKSYRREYIVPPDRRADIRATSTLEMYQKAVTMLDNAIEGSMMFYKDVIYLAQRAAETQD